LVRFINVPILATGVHIALADSRILLTKANQTTKVEMTLRYSEPAAPDIFQRFDAPAGPTALLCVATPDKPWKKGHRIQASVSVRFHC
ncbi:MAG: hypothetical protein ACYC3W_11470, partial [Candidatus Nanopelagicales bacterium]